MKRTVAILLIGLFLLSGCSSPKEQKPRILVSPKGLVLSFWLSVKAGAEKAGKEFDAEIIWKGPSLETDIAGQIDIIQDNINKQVDAMVLAACDANALVSIIESADAAGIPVITIDSGVESDKPKSLIATDNMAAIFAIAISLPWSNLFFSLFDASSSNSVALNIILMVIAIAINACILYVLFSFMTAWFAITEMI